MIAWLIGGLSWLVFAALLVASRDELELLSRRARRRIHRGSSVILCSTALLVPAAFTGGVTHYVEYTVDQAVK